MNFFVRSQMFSLKEIAPKSKTWSTLSLKFGISSTLLKKIRQLYLGKIAPCTDEDYDKVFNIIDAEYDKMAEELSGYLLLSDWARLVRKNPDYIYNMVSNAGHGASVIVKYAFPWSPEDPRKYIKADTTFDFFLKDYPKGFSAPAYQKQLDKRRKENKTEVSLPGDYDEALSMCHWIKNKRPSINVDLNKKTIDGMKMTWNNGRLVLDNGCDLNDYINYVKIS